MLVCNGKMNRVIGVSMRLLDDFYLHRELSPAVPSGEETTPLPVSLKTPSSPASRQCGTRLRRGVEEEEQLLDVGLKKSARLFPTKRTQQKRKDVDGELKLKKGDRKSRQSVIGSRVAEREVTIVSR